MTTGPTKEGPRGEEQVKTFPLVIWERTDEYKQLIQQAQAKLDELTSKWERPVGEGHHVGRIEGVNNRGEPEFWVNAQISIYDHGKKTLEEARKKAMAHGTSNWWTVEDLEEFLRQKGRRFIGAMEEQGFRPHKTRSGQWSRVDEKWKEANSERKRKEFNSEIDGEWLLVKGEEAERLNGLWVMRNKPWGSPRGYSLKVDKKGLIFVSFDANPFFGAAEQIGRFAEELRNRGHLNKEQNGFVIEARNIKIGKEYAIHVKAVKADGSVVECLLPTSIYSGALYDLAKKFVDFANLKPEPVVQ